MKAIHLKAHILVPLALVSALVLMAFVYGIYHEEQEHLTEDLARSIQSVEGHYRMALKERAHKLGAALEVIAADPVLRSALTAHDRDTLLARSLPIFQRLKTEYNITHFYFHDAQRTNILRVHQPIRYGDSINRFTALGAEKTKTLYYGVELGPLGTFTLRAVLPLWQGDKLLGYIELGEEVDQIIHDMERVFGVGLVVVIDKQYLRQSDWRSGMRMLGRKAEWGRFPDVIVASQTLETLPQGLSAILSRPMMTFPSKDIEVTQGRQRYRGRILTLQDAGERTIGSMVVLRNMTAGIQSTRNTVGMITGSALVLGVFLFLLFYIILGRTERKLQSSMTELQQATIQSARMGRILEHSWNEIYAFDAETLHFIDVSDGARKNLGYSMEEMQQMTPVDLKPEFTCKQFEALIEALRQGEKQQLCFETIHRRKDGSEYPVEVRLQLSTEKMSLVFIAIIQDISERKHYLEELEHKALYDTLTDLPNRSLLLDRLEYTLKIAHRQESLLAVFMIDVVRLREINDLLGHQNGDLVLKEVASRLQKELRTSDTVARLGGDEFVVILPGVDINQAHTVVKKIRRQFELPITIDDTPLELESAIGIALYPEHGDGPAILLQHADIAMRVAKNEAGGVSIYDPEDDPFSVRRLKLHGELRQAISDQTLAVYYQPKINISTGKITSVEALSRWPHPTEGMISPVDFIPMVEQSGLIRPFTLWVLEEAIKQCKLWSDAGIDLSVAVNLSTRNLLDPTLADTIAKLLESQQVNPDRLVLEITESAVMSRPEHALKILTHLHAMGIKLSIDDFGTGYSSLSYLKQLPVAELKIDYSFVSNILNNDNDAVIVRSTIDLAHNLGLSVVAEGVEDKDTLDWLTLLQCDTAQGYYFSRPLPSEELACLIAKSDWGLSEI